MAMVDMLLKSLGVCSQVTLQRMSFQMISMVMTHKTDLHFGYRSPQEVKDIGYSDLVQSIIPS